jgi:hypothetical protein
MTFNLYGVDNDDNLMLLAEIDTGGEEFNPALILDMFLDQAGDDYDEYEQYAGIDLDEGTVVVMAVPDHESVNTRRNIEVMTADDEVEEEKPAPKKRGRPPAKKNTIKVDEVPVEDDEEEKPAPKKRGRPAGSKNKADAKKPGPKSKAASSKAKSSGIKTNSASEE